MPACRRDGGGGAPATVWVRFDTGQEAPLERTDNGLGFKRCSPADTIRAEVAEADAALRQLEAQRQVVLVVMERLRDGQPLPPHLLPPAPVVKASGKSTASKSKGLTKAR